MGSSTSRNAVVSSPTGANEQRRKESTWMFHSRCFRHYPNSPENSSNSAYHKEACNGSATASTTSEVVIEAGLEKHRNNGRVKSPEAHDLNASKSSLNYNERNKQRLFHSVSDASSSSTQVYSVRGLEPSISFDGRSSDRREITEHPIDDCHSTRSSHNQDHSNIRLSRATSLGSSEAYSLFSRRLRHQFSNVGRNSVDHLKSGTDTQQGQGNSSYDVGESRFRQHNVHSMQVQQCTDLPLNALECGDAFSEPFSVSQSENLASQQDMAGNLNQATVSDQNVSAVMHSSMVRESRDAIRIQRRLATPEHIEANVSFRRTRSVGRLRDRVLRRPVSSEGSFGILQAESIGRDTRRHNGRRFWDTLTRASSHRHIGAPATATPDQFLRTLRSMSDSRRQREERTQMNEDAFNNNGSLLENRSLYLEERRRRARSQVRALQRLSNSFENLAGHERACILAGHHRTGHCSCQNSGRTDDSNTRASISRIIMLAEALFEVLDEIHHQSMALPSRSTASSLGSFPAPDNVVDSMPVRTYTKREKIGIEDAAQCYICLVEYEEGEHVRVLPCHHEFHLLCVDKWLKEVHRVCPLCRGNVCDANLTNYGGFTS